MKTALIVLAAEEETTHVVNELPMPSIGFGILTLVILFSLLFISSLFKGMSHQHD